MQILIDNEDLTRVMAQIALPPDMPMTYMSQEFIDGMVKSKIAHALAEEIMKMPSFEIRREHSTINDTYIYKAELMLYKKTDGKDGDK